MTLNRKAELQRRLAMAPVATPPAGLADRIKADIPENLRFTPERGTEPRKSMIFNLRIAASIVLLASSIYMVLRLSRTESITQPASLAVKKDAAPVQTASTPLPTTPPEPGSAREQPRTDLPAMPRVPPPSVATSNGRITAAKRREADAMTTGAPVYTSSIEDEQSAPKTERIIVAQSAPASSVPLPSPAPSVAAPVAAMDQAAPSAADGGGFAPERSSVAKASARERKDTRDDTAPARNFVALQEAITRGETLRNVDTSAIVQHFAAPERAPAGLRIELEASATPLDSTKWLLRVSVDAPDATSTVIDLVFGDAILSHHALTGSPAPNETALYEIEFKPNAKPDQTIATAKAGKTEGTLRVADLRKWNFASPRMKRASLAAAWARTLQAHTQPDAIVAKAREAHIDELANMAERAERNR